jgi:2',3'-cyclic-nucleotide 2'-phosphodiesterase/3'-nucleotidase
MPFKSKLLLVLVGLWASFSLAGETPVTLLFTADLHGHLAGEVSESGMDPAGGLLRCATLIKNLRSQEPNLILVDGGDLCQGTAASFLTRGEVMLVAVKILRYDALVPGNHEFDWGVTNLLRLYDRAQLPVLAANLAGGSTRNGELPWRPFLIKEVAGARVAIVGLANPLTPSWIRPRLLGGARFEDSVGAVRRILPAVRAQRPDVLVLALHQGWRPWGDDAANQVNALARAFPEFDVILGAHTHQAVDPIAVQSALYIQPAAYGLWLAKVRLLVDTRRQRVTRRTAELLEVENTLQPDPELEAACAAALEAERTYLRQELGQAAGELQAKSDYPGQSQIQALIARAFLEATGADAVFHGTLSGASLARGMIRMQDVWRIVPFENTIAVAALAPDELREILEENCRFLKTDQFRGVYGFTYEFYPDRPPGAQVGNIRLADGRGWLEGERIRVAFNSHDLASAGGRFARLREIADRPSSRLEETALDSREAVIAYIRKHSPLEIEAVEGVRIMKK